MGPLTAFSSFVLAVLVGAPSSPLAPPSRGGLPPEFDVRVEWELPAKPPYAGEAFPVTLEISLPSTWDNGNLLQLFPQPLGLPIQLTGFEALESGRMLALPELGGAKSGPNHEVSGPSQTVALDGEIAQATGPLFREGPDGQTATFSVKRWFKAPRAGWLDLPGAGVRYAVATEFREDFVQGRVPVDRRTESASGEASRLEVLPIPEAGRPYEFTGAVGRFELDAALSPSSVAVGESATLTVTIHPIGRTARPDLPKEAVTLEASEALHEVGRTTTHDGESGTQTIAITLLAQAPSIDAHSSVSLAYFDPGLDPPGYEFAVASAPAFQVRRAASSSSDREVETNAVTPEEAVGDEDRIERPIPYWTIGVASFIFALAVASVVRRHWPHERSESDSDSPSQNA